MTDSNAKAPSGAATPAEAVACLRECLDVWAPDITVSERAALESLGAEVGRLQSKLVRDAVAAREVLAIESDKRAQAFAEADRAQARIRALESELAEKTAACQPYRGPGGDGPPWNIVHERTPVALDRGEAVALREIADAWARYQRRDISQEEFEGTVADRVELHALPALPSEPVKP